MRKTMLVAGFVVTAALVGCGQGDREAQRAELNPPESSYKQVVVDPVSREDRTWWLAYSDFDECNPSKSPSETIDETRLMYRSEGKYAVVGRVDFRGGNGYSYKTKLIGENGLPIGYFYVKKSDCEAERGLRDR